MIGGGLDLVVAIPACNEEALLPRCIAAIERQTGLADVKAGILVLANNCTDNTVSVCLALAASSPLPIQCDAIELPGDRAHAGWARRLAMEAAAALIRQDGILVSTDADSYADPDWLAAHLAELGAPVEAVAGRVSGDWDDLCSLPENALAVGALEWRYQAAAAELEALLDPLPHDPWPRHRLQSGANFSVCRAAWHIAGGVPPLPCGEDRAFLAAVVATGGRVRHALAPHVTVSGRTDGRATGGMSTALASRAAGNCLVDSNIQPAHRFVSQQLAKARQRRAGGPPILASAAEAKAEEAARHEQPLQDADRLKREVERLEAYLDVARQGANGLHLHA